MSPPPSSQVHIFNPEGHPPQVPSYSHISSVPISSTHRLVSLAGQVGVPPTTTASDHIPSFPDQVRAALANVDRCLAAAGITKRDIVSNRHAIVHPGLLNWIFLQIRITNFAALVWKTEDFAVVEWVRETVICDVAIGSIHECYWDIAWILASEQIESWNSNGGGDG
ncbi:hypothetical protein KC367_g1519 [Hortaea werneckii]|nr:hypothetical protein KC367_g1519 [Hortaea werneckii]